MKDSINLSTANVTEKDGAVLLKLQGQNKAWVKSADEYSACIQLADDDQETFLKELEEMALFGFSPVFTGMVYKLFFDGYNTINIDRDLPVDDSLPVFKW